MTDSKKWTFATTGVVAGLTALAAVTTLVIRIPIPATTGYFNLGDIFVILAGLWVGPLGGAIVGGVGPALADAIGFPVFIPATFITKCLEGLVVGIVADRRANASITRNSIAAFSGGVVIVVGYFVFEAIVYPALGKYIPAFAITDIGAAIVEVIPNSVQGMVGAVGGLALWKMLSGFEASQR